MSFNCEIENKLHQARILLLNSHHQEAIQKFVECLDDLEKHKKECEGEELTWTETCFNRTLEELNLIRDAHPEIQIRVQESDDETELPQPVYEEASTTTEQIPVAVDTNSIASEEIPVNVEQTQQPNGESSLLNEIERLSKVAIDKIVAFDEAHHVSDDISQAINTGKTNIENYLAEKPLGDRIKEGYNTTVNYCKEGYNTTVNYCKENHVVERSVDAVKTTACYIYKGVVYVTKIVTKAVRQMIDNYSTPATATAVPMQTTQAATPETPANSQ